MRFSTATTATALAALISSSTAIITGIMVPATIKPGDEITAIITTQGYIQSVEDIAIVFGHASVDEYPGNLGSVDGSFYLGPKESNIVTNITKTFTVPASVEAGEGLITASLMSLYGAREFPTLIGYNVTVMFGDVTSKELKSSSAK